MNTRSPGFGKLVLALLFALAPALTQAADAKPAVYRFSPVNQWDINRTATYWNPIIQYVSEKSGIQLQLKIGRTSADTTSYVLAQEVEFVFSNHLFSPEREALGWNVFGRRNAPPLGCAGSQCSATVGSEYTVADPTCSRSQTAGCFTARRRWL